MHSTVQESNVEWRRTRRLACSKNRVCGSLNDCVDSGKDRTAHFLPVRPQRNPLAPPPRLSSRSALPAARGTIRHGSEYELALRREWHWKKQRHRIVWAVVTGLAASQPFRCLGRWGRYLAKARAQH